MTPGYSGTPLRKKLGIKAGFIVVTINAPNDYQELLVPLPDSVKITDERRNAADLIHLFTNSRDELFAELAKCVREIKQDGTIWVSWYKKAAKLPTEIIEDTIREAAFPLGLVDVKVCAVDNRWSGLKLVIRRENRV
jgi:bifunctional DNA-binding transcriptional regulator/antitoxin component of YhaV-PrlF toxin-antitoxin module